MSTPSSSSAGSETPEQAIVETPEESPESSTPDDEEGKSAEAMTMEERRVKLERLRAKMRTSTNANRKSLVEESAKAKMTARDAARLERQKKLAEMLRSQAEAEERGEDLERSKNWEWTIEDNENWEKKKARKARRADYEFHDDAHAARRRYKKDLDLLKPDLEVYNRQKEQVLGLVSGALSQSGSSTLSGSSFALTTFDVAGSQMVPTTEQRMAMDNFYRDANTLLYADNKPTEDAIDRVVGKINQDIDKKAKFSRKRLNEEEGDITYINERNRVFNKKIARYYDKYTAEIRASFERGTAL
ncbi:hypothetical protein PAXINDRAFT_173205 [Paxillus involutus ATCC 200175]|uniref:Pre-mRNA-splicing factor SYF2 n=1 Tax=Paxillus involutus ATCC 200175 TaxID=664439 RepID=A0A0C9TIW7_PAXIN|nr:hypothetical protein PAXINDRAFT_173205 [Paxillus involutus ATCC 200175]